MASVTWADGLQAVGAVLTPVVVAILAYVVVRAQSRSEGLLKIRTDYYRSIVPDLNRLMCYMTFIGTWRDQSPLDIIRLKRRLDEQFYCAAPLFSPEVLSAYEALMGMTFVPFGSWGEDARLKTNAYRRRTSWILEEDWNPRWDACFALTDDMSITASELKKYRETYDTLIAALVLDLNLNRTRARYTTDLVSLNAHAPRIQDIKGSSPPD